MPTPSLILLHPVACQNTIAVISEGSSHYQFSIARLSRGVPAGPPARLTCATSYGQVPSGPRPGYRCGCCLVLATQGFTQWSHIPIKLQARGNRQVPIGFHPNARSNSRAFNPQRLVTHRRASETRYPAGGPSLSYPGDPLVPRCGLPAANQGN